MDHIMRQRKTVIHDRQTLRTSNHETGYGRAAGFYNFSIEDLPLERRHDIRHKTQWVVAENAYGIELTVNNSGKQEAIYL